MKVRRWDSTLTQDTGKPLRRKSWLERKSRLRPWGRRAKRGISGGDVCEAARSSPCALSGAAPPNEAHHVREHGETRRDWNERGECRVLPLSREAHRDWHGLSGEKWAAKYGYARPTKGGLGALAREFGERYEEVNDGR